MKQLGSLKLYDVEELASLLDVQEKTIRAYLRDGKLKGRKIARKWYIPEEAIQEYFSQPEPAKDGQEEG
jgi:excisionase family DNA binding protein